MKKHLLFGAAAALLSFGAQAATVVQNYEEAKPLLGEDGLIIVVYPDGWNAKLTKLGKDILNSQALSSKAGSAALMGIGIPNFNTKEVQEERQKLLGPIKLPNPKSHPALLLFEASGRHYATIDGSEFIGENFFRSKNYTAEVEAAANIAGKRLATLKKQREMVAKAEKAEGRDKAALLGEAARLEGISRPDKVVDLIRKADPEDSTGYATALSLNIYALNEKCAKSKEWRNALAEVEQHLKNPAFTPTERQLLYSTAIGLLRRNGNADDREKMHAYLVEMRNLDPDSRYGRSYSDFMRIWGSTVTVDNAWNPQMLPKKDAAVEINGTVKFIKDPGVYRVTFNYQRGKHALMLSKVQLFDGKDLVATDTHDSFCGSRHTDNVYTLNVTKPVKEPHLIITTKMNGNIDSAGRIFVEK